MTTTTTTTTRNGSPGADDHNFLVSDELLSEVLQVRAAGRQLERRADEQ